MTDAWFEVAFGAHYPSLYAHRNRAEAEQCFDLLPTLAPLSQNGKPVLDLGCGDGRHLEFLTSAGYSCVGLDLSDSLLKIAHQRPGMAPLVRADMRYLSFKNQSLDTILSLFTAFGYFGPIRDNAVVVKEVSRVLNPGGHWFLDYFNCDRIVQELGNEEKFVRERVEAGMRIKEVRQYSASSAQVSKNVELIPESQPENNSSLPSDGLRYTEKVAVFKLSEMDELAAMHGLERVTAAGGYDGVPLGEGPRWILVYRKTKQSQ